MIERKVEKMLNKKTMLNNEDYVNLTLSRISWPQEDNKVPQEIYTDHDLFKIEMEKIFSGPTWHLIAHESEIPNPGDFKTTFIGEVPVLISRDENQDIHVLVNACAHRGAKVVCDNRGNTNKGFRCIYHAWTYNLKGDLIGVSLPDDFPKDFRKEDFGLPKIRTQKFLGCIFATFKEDTPPLEEYLAELTEGLSLVFKDGKLKYLGSQKVVFENNWKIYVENIYDGYHTNALHKAFQMLKMKAAGGEQFSPNYEKYGHVWQQYRTLPPEEKELLKDLSILSMRTKQQPEHRIINIFPGSIISDQVDTLAIRYVFPKTIDKTEVHFAVFAREGETEEIVQHRIRQGSNLFGPEGFITLEDASALSRMQMGATARGENVILKGTPKRFPPYRVIDEASIRHFYNAYRQIIGF